MVEVCGADGAAGGGLMGSLGALFTNPWTAVAAGAAIGGFFLFKHFFGDKSIKRLRNATKSLYNVNIDKDTAKSLKAIGEQRFGKGAASKRPNEVVALEESKDIIRAYAEATGQPTDKLGASRTELQNEYYKGNRFVSKFGGFRANGGSVQAGVSYVVGERRAELFTPTTNGVISPSVPSANGNSDASMMPILLQVMGTVIETLQSFSAVPADYVLAKGNANNPSIISGAVESQTTNNPRFNANFNRFQTAGVNW